MLMGIYVLSANNEMMTPAGFVLGKKSSPEENSHSWETNATFHDITYWNHDYVPSHNDDFFRAFHWLTVANAVSRLSCSSTRFLNTI